MEKLKSTLGILAIALVTLTVMSCKDNKKEQTNEEGHPTEMMMNHDNSDGHHDEETMTHDNSDGHHHEAEGANSSARDIEASTQKNGATSAIIDSYIQIKNALVSDDKNAAAKGATIMLSSFSNFDMSQIGEAQHKEFMEIAESAKEQANHIVENPIDHQREHFETLSTDVMDLITLLGTDKTLYQDYCPMKKVSWLSETKDIKNPFYGSEMVTCGNVKKQIN
tara:strand:- start:522 stop:1190 length:669 start_codon:yes stop_codon:yes gene_type:complete